MRGWYQISGDRDEDGPLEVILWGDVHPNFSLLRWTRRSWHLHPQATGAVAGTLQDYLRVERDLKNNLWTNLTCDVHYARMAIFVPRPRRVGDSNRHPWPLLPFSYMPTMGIFYVETVHRLNATAMSWRHHRPGLPYSDSVYAHRQETFEVMNKIIKPSTHTA